MTGPADPPFTPRREDRDRLTGRARYTDDHCPPDALHAAFVRSEFAHARLREVDVAPARRRDGVVAAFTATDLAALGGPTAVTASCAFPGSDEVDRPLLVADVARFVGDPVALVVAESRRAARDAVDAVDVEAERLPAVTDAREALAREEPALTHRGTDRVEWSVGDEAATEAAFADADRVVSVDLRNQRLAPCPLEPRGLLAEPTEGEGPAVTITASTQTPHRDRERIAGALGLPEAAVRVVAPAVGGAFGTKGANPYPEEPLVAWCARHLDRPVAWVATRTEGLRTDHQGRDVTARGDLAVDADGRFRALRVRGEVAVGAYPLRGPSSCLKPQLLSGAYRIPAIHCRAVGVLTNTTPLGPYRGAGRPESIYVVERLVDRAAAALGIDPAALRRRNFIQPSAFPYETPTGAVYDSGDYEPALDRALDLADYAAVRARDSPDEDGRYRGVGIASFVEHTGSTRIEAARIEVAPSGAVTAYCGTADQGQGHATAFARVVAAELGVDPEAVTVREGDTADLPTGTGTFGSRSAPVGSSALVACADDLRERGREIAAERLGVARSAVAFEDGAFVVRDGDRSLSLAAVASGAPRPDGSTVDEGADPEAGDAPVDPLGETGLAAERIYEPEGYAFAFGTHVAVVAVDPETGEVEVERYVAVDDCGPQIDPRIVEGQVHGSVVQGLGQALCERVAYDDAGTPLTGSLQDYALPRADGVPDIETDFTVTPSPRTPRGVKGVGEAGTIAAPPAVVNAVADALAPLGVAHVDTPFTSERVWRAIRDADGPGSGSVGTD
ncbi:MAG: xanthine dehydrogenase family protein molybdopterin-binding subunit [Haloferacaceae archaeon]